MCFSCHPPVNRLSDFLCTLRWFSVSFSAFKNTIWSDFVLKEQLQSNNQLVVPFLEGDLVVKLFLCTHDLSIAVFDQLIAFSFAFGLISVLLSIITFIQLTSSWINLGERNDLFKKHSKLFLEPFQCTFLFSEQWIWCSITSNSFCRFFLFLFWNCCSAVRLLLFKWQIGELGPVAPAQQAALNVFYFLRRK